MRFIQRGEKKLEVHNNKTFIPVLSFTVCLGLILAGLTLFLRPEIHIKAIGIAICATGAAVFIWVLYKVSGYRYLVFTIPEETLIERNITGTWNKTLETGGISNIEIKVDVAEDLSALYSVIINYVSGKQYIMEHTDNDYQAESVADILCFFFDKPLLRKMPNKPDQEIDPDSLNKSMYNTLREKYPQGIPRKDPPPYDFLLVEKARFRTLLKLISPPRSLVFHSAKYIAVLFLVILAFMALFTPRYTIVGVGLFIAGVVYFLLMKAIESGNFEEIIITPEELRYHYHHPTSEVKYVVPLEEVKQVKILQQSGYRLKIFDCFKKKDPLSEPEDQQEDVEIYILTERAVIGIESCLNRDMAEYMKHLVENSVYVMSQKSERERRDDME
ncbi:MAG: hypothetical protein LWY06_15110 [Firmicutes bacterium]|nr:hypothetical protein [Bacillota bacterium]